MCAMHKVKASQPVFSTAMTLPAGVRNLYVQTTLPDGTVQHYEEDVNRRYEREMEYFVDYALTGSGESCNPPALALKVLKLTLGENV